MGKGVGTVCVREGLDKKHHVVVFRKPLNVVLEPANPWLN